MTISIVYILYTILSVIVNAIPPRTIKILENSAMTENFKNHFLPFKPYDFKGRKKKEIRNLPKK